jgi:hypothetical protein
MGVFTAIAVAVKAIAAKITFAAVAKFVGSILVSQLVGRMLAKRAGQGAGGGDGGGRIQLPPATDNKIPVIYGTAFIGGPIIDAYLTPDQKTMYYVVALAEKTDNGTISFGNVYYDGKLVEWAGGQTSSPNGTAVQALITNNSNPGTAQRDTRPANKINMWFYNNGSNSPTNSASNAYDIFPQWAGDPNYAMTNCAFVVVSVNYNTDAGTTSLGAITVQIKNTESGESTGVYRPGTAIYDYLTNTRYGCAIPAANVDGTPTTGSLGDLNTYSDQTVPYTPVGGGSSSQARYRVNGPLDTAQSCLNNLQILVDSCDSWLQYSELTGKWRVVINKGYNQSPNSQTLNQLFLVNSDNLVGGINISPIDLNETYNEVEVAYPNTNIKDQTDFQVIELQDTAAVVVMSPNEAINRLNVTLPVVNNAVQAKYLALRRLLQSREDITISFQTDFSGIQVEAGDVIRVTHETYGWTDKLFRVLTVAEQTFEDNTVGTQMVAFEYNGTIYTDNSIQDFVPAFNTGLVDPNVFDIPNTPVVANGTNANSGTTYFTVTGTTPANGLTTYFDFNYGNSTNVAQHILYRTAQNGVGDSFAANANVTISINDLVAGNYYFSVTARNDFAGRQSNSTTSAFVWPGPEVTAYNPNTNTGGITGNNIQPGSVNPNIFAPGTEFIDVVNTLPVCNANTIGSTVYLTTDGKLYNCNGTAFIPVASNTLITGTITETQIANNSISTPKIQANAITATQINVNAVTSDKIFAGAVTAGKIDVTNLQAISANLGTVTSGTLRTSSSNTVNRVEISSDGNFPLWYGNNTKTAANAFFYVDTGGNAYFAGNLGAAGGTTTVDISAIIGNGGVGFMKGAQFVSCRDNTQVTFNNPYPVELSNRVQVVYVGGGLSYTNDPNITGPQYQKFEALNIDANGFLPSLKLSEVIGTGNITYTNVNVSFSTNSNTVATKTGSDEAYDDVYNFILNEVRIYCDYGPFNYGGNDIYYGIAAIDIFANGNSGNFNIYSDIVYLSTENSPGNAYANGWGAAGVVDGMGANSTFTITSTLLYGANGTVNGNLVYYTTSNVTPNVVTATPTGVPDVTALVFIT